MLSIESSDQELLDLLSADQAIIVQLTQRATYELDLLQYHDATNTHRSLETKTRQISRAGWQLQPLNDDPASGQRPTTRILYGELHIPEDTPPRCHILNFQLEASMLCARLKAELEVDAIYLRGCHLAQYAVVMNSFQAIGFTTASTSEPLLSESVVVGTAFASGPHPRAYLPPGYIRYPQAAPPRRWSFAGALSRS